MNSGSEFIFIISFIPNVIVITIYPLSPSSSFAEPEQTLQSLSRISH